MTEMKKHKKKLKERGITLIALVITIIVLLILAGVALATLTGDSGILNNAESAKGKTNLANAKEQVELATQGAILENISATGKMTVTYANLKKELDNIVGNGKYEIDPEQEADSWNVTVGEYKVEILSNGSIQKNDIGTATVDTIVGTNSTMNGEKPSATNPVIPKGFKAINTPTSSWDAENGPEVTKGLVISDGTSEFVFIPVANINEFARVKSGTENYQGVSYNFSEGTANEIVINNISQRKAIEPFNLEEEQGDSETNMSIWTENLYQDSFDSMVESVIKYEGFYVGRYETSLNGSTAQSVSGATPMNSLNWYTMYENSLTYSKNNTNLGVQSEMIWGCQWDAMLRFILTGDEADHVCNDLNDSPNAPHDLRKNVWNEDMEDYEEVDSGNFISNPYRCGGTNYSEDYKGSIEYNDIASNIYDLEGNVSEWTQETSANGEQFGRNRRGGTTGSRNNMFYRLNGPILNSDFYDVNGSRLSLYVK